MFSFNLLVEIYRIKKTFESLFLCTTCVLVVSFQAAVEGYFSHFGYSIRYPDKCGFFFFPVFIIRSLGFTFLVAACVAHLSLSGSHHVKANGLSTTKLNSICNTCALTVQKKSNRSRKFSVSARYGDEGSRRGSGGDFIAGFILGGAVFGAVAYISLLHR